MLDLYFGQSGVAAPVSALLHSRPFLVLHCRTLAIFPPDVLAARRARLPRIDYPEELPVSGRRDEIAAALKAHQVIIVCGETGSGKTTQLPKICLEAGRGIAGLIGHTQPRRIAARATAARIAQELRTELGQAVGYKIRFTERVSRDAYVKLMTDGILLAETQGDPLLSSYDTIIIDEAHERSLNIDFLLGYLRQLLPKRPDLKIIITSATIDAQRFALHFAAPAREPGAAPVPAPVIEVSGRLYPVEMRYRPWGKAVDESDAEDEIDAVVDAVDEAIIAGPGDILIFLPGEREIREAAEALRKHHFARGGEGGGGGAASAVRGAAMLPDILPLFARLSVAEQERVFKPSGNQRRIVLATNVAETSLTVPGIRFVIDTGQARVKRYSYRNKVEQLQVENIAQASANQRAGRCGRVASGICIRLYGEDDYAARPKFTDPEILRSSLAGVILRMKSLHLGDIEAFPFIEAPPPKAIADGYLLLQELGALDDGNQLTKTGEELARLPLDPRIGRMILAARDQQALTEVLIIASALSVQDPRDRPADKKDAADRAHAKFHAEKSEFMGWLKLWAFFNESQDALSNRKLQGACREHFLSYLRMREWRDIYSQLHTIVAEHKWRMNDKPATFEQIHRGLLAGLLGNIGMKSETEASFTGARGIKFFAHPGSALGKKTGRWVMGAELVDTTRLYARTLANIEPLWIEQVGGHLVKTLHSDPHWEKTRGQPVAFERGTLYGLPVYTQRRVDYAAINAKHARELFIRAALVEGEWDTHAPFFVHNQRQMREIEELEHKSRRPDVLVDDELIFAFYDALVPPEVCTVRAFDAWRGEAEKKDPKLLFLKRADLMRHEAAGITTDVFPKQLRLGIGATEFALTYHFEPGSARDGVTAAVPLAALNQIVDTRTEWLVPGMRREKVQALLKSLPQRLRRHCVPLPDFAARFCHEVKQSDAPLAQAVAHFVREQTGLAVPVETFRADTLPAHLVMNFKLIDEHGRQLDMGRNLAELRATHRTAVEASFERLAELAGLGAGFGTGTGTGARAGAGAGAAIGTGTAQTQRAGGGKGGAAGHAGGTHHNASDGARGTIGAGVVGGIDRSGSAASSAAGGRILHANCTNWDFGDLEDIVEVHNLIGYPALVDYQTHVNVELIDAQRDADLSHRQGVMRLLQLQMKEQLTGLRKTLPLRALGLQFLPFGGESELAQQLIEAGFARASLTDPLPRKQAEFMVRRSEAKLKLGLITQEIAALTGRILDEQQTLNKKLAGAKAYPQVVQDIQSQMQRLLPKNFIIATPYAQLAHLPRYLKAASVRLDKLRADPARDAKLASDLAPLQHNYLRKFQEHAKARVNDARLEEFRWLLEELRVSLFAQELKTPMPVSVKRLQKAWDAYRNL